MSIQSDIHNNFTFALGLVTEAVADNTAQESAIFDMQNFASLEYIITIGTLVDVDATFTVLLEHGDDSGLSDAAAVPDDQMLGTEADASFIFSDDDTVNSLGYIGDKRFVRMTITPALNASAATFAMTTAAMPLHRGTVN